MHTIESVWNSWLLFDAKRDNAAETKVKITSCLAAEQQLKGHFVPCYIILLREIFMLEQVREICLFATT